MKRLMIAAFVLGAALAAYLPGTARADDDKLEVKINGRMPTVTVPTADGPVKIMRNQDTANTIHPDYAKTSRKCPPFCVQPMQVAPGVTTVGEVELLEFAKEGDRIVLMADGRVVEVRMGAGGYRASFGTYSPPRCRPLRTFINVRHAAELAVLGLGTPPVSTQVNTSRRPISVSSARDVYPSWTSLRTCTARTCASM